MRHGNQNFRKARQCGYWDKRYKKLKKRSQRMIRRDHHNMINNLVTDEGAGLQKKLGHR